MQTLNPDAIIQLTRIIENEMANGETNLRKITVGVDKAIALEGDLKSDQFEKSIQYLLYIANFIDMRIEN